WLAEHPDECCAFGSCVSVPLTNFSSVTCSSIVALGIGQGGPLAGPGWSSTPIQLIPRARRVFGDVSGSAGSTAGATPGSPGADCGTAASNCTFTINFVPNATAT